MSSKHVRGVKPALSKDAEALTKAPPAPSYLSTQAKAEWRRVLPLLVGRGVITKADLTGVEAYCVAAGAARQIAEAMAGDLPDLRLGGMQIRYMQTAHQFTAEYGLTPTSRARMGAGGDGGDDASPNPLAI